MRAAAPTGDADRSIARAGSIDPARGLGLLFDAHGERVMLHLYLMLRDYEAARDLTQETFLRAYRAPELFGGGVRYRPWLLRVAMNLALNRIRDERRRAKAPPPPARDDASLDPAEIALRRQTNDELVRELRGLPARYRQALILKYFEEFPVAEIAAVMEVPIGTVLTLLYRGRLILRRRLSR